MSQARRGRAGALLVAAASTALAGCETQISNVSVVLEDARATFEVAADGALSVTGSVLLTSRLDVDASEGTTSEVWINTVFLSGGGLAQNSWQEVPLSWVATERGLPFDVTEGDSTPVQVTFGGVVDAAPSDLCDVTGGMDVYFSRGDAHFPAWMYDIEWPADAHPCSYAGAP
jgi:hypothetical protein